MRTTALVMACGLIAASTSLAQESRPAPAVEEVRKAFQHMQELDKDPFGSPEDLRRAAESGQLDELMNPGMKRSAEKVRARAAFVDLFERADWPAFDRTADAELLREGLWKTGYRALGRGDGATAKRAFEAYTKECDTSPDARARVQLLPKAMLLTGEIDEAVRRLEASVARAPQGAHRGQLLIALGDARLVAGDTERARAAWEQAAATPFGTEARGPVMDVRRQAVVRTGFVGRPPPSLDAVEAVGGDAPTWSALKGKVVVVQAFSTECKACRGSMPWLIALRDRHPGEDLVVLGLTIVESEGFLPVQDTPEPFWVGEAVEGIAKKDFRKHLETFRGRIGINYPWLVQKLADHLPWNQLDPHPIVVVGRDGKVAFAQVGGGEISSVHAIVTRLLAAR